MVNIVAIRSIEDVKDGGSRARKRRSANTERMTKMEQRYIPIKDVKTRAEDNGDLYVSGYFAVFGSDYELWPGATESIAPGAFDESITGDVRALWNHNDDIVLGRTGAGTL